ncbi:sensor histidine kinase [Streptomyces sp. SID5473]|uniref:histidine kinase n=1 Tax=Streptomyces tsukubensis (strain DSM 42081 / NBRC 108919 / NRRL 18488 / 9993) TaxID=1114943 RepID=A0A7G3UDN6_STRT9|nr:histidine kinase [Streptomyces tsukubensis]MYS67530.1 sensor histidine kinase [Streptomyces sp. SID5473]QKM68108.1 histidine kinase [Streptomyces tsukubensis NRRL18488]TAI44508.1 sensor histidine kinase [Streptomyces tsukubensis]
MTAGHLASHPAGGPEQGSSGDFAPRPEKGRPVAARGWGRRARPASSGPQDRSKDGPKDRPQDRWSQDGPGHGPERLPSPGFAYDARTWKEVVHLLANLPLSLLHFVYVIVTILVGTALSLTVIGLPVLATGLAGARLIGRSERARARRLLGVRVDEPSPLRGAHPDDGFFGRLWAALKDPVGWRAVLYCLIRLPWGVVTFVITLLGVVLLWPALGHLARGMGNADRVMVRGLLSPSDELERRIAELESDRGIVVDTAAADLRRIERDLHDGAQARLVALAMGLGLAKEKLLEDPDAAAVMVDEAHGEVKLALQELRDLARGIHPAVLTDRGLDAALSSVASRCTVPVSVSVELAERPAAAIEGIAYFTVSELLQNVSKHSGARQAGVDVWRVEGRMMLQVTDDGKGGARLDGGTGMAGLAERLGAVDGLFVLESPVGGPTTVTVEIPWRDRDAMPAAGGTGRASGGRG